MSFALSFPVSLVVVVGEPLAISLSLSLVSHAIAVSVQIPTLIPTLVRNLKLFLVLVSSVSLDSPDILCGDMCSCVNTQIVQFQGLSVAVLCLKFLVILEHLGIEIVEFDG